MIFGGPGAFFGRKLNEKGPALAVSCFCTCSVKRCTLSESLKKTVSFKKIMLVVWDCETTSLFGKRFFSYKM